MRSYFELMNDQITMPACMMTDGKDDKLFDNFSITAQKIGVCECIGIRGMDTALVGGRGDALMV